MPVPLRRPPGPAHITCVSNSSKSKGDRNELAAVLELVAKAGDLVLPNAQRKLGAGRREDVGDLHVFANVAVQVRAVAEMGRGLRTAATDSVEQARHGGVPFALGMVPVPRARKESVRWLASCLSWPGSRPGDEEIAVFTNPGAAIAHLRRDDLGVPRTRRIAQLRRLNTCSVFVAPIEAWIQAYRRVRVGAGETGGVAAYVVHESRHELAAAG